jgi:hypothetical protein
LEAAFVALQRKECAAFYANAAELKTILGAMSQNRLGYEVLPVWFSLDQIKAEETAITERNGEAAKALTARQQAAEASRNLNAEKAAKYEQERLVRQDALRAANSDASTGALKQITQIADDFILRDKGMDFPNTFPTTASLIGQRKGDLWVMKNVLADIVEFGTADWQGRRLDTILVKLQANSENATMGRYATDCVIVGYLIDKEFAQVRDAYEASCAAAIVPMNAWLTGHQFISKWNVQ